MQIGIFTDGFECRRFYAFSTYGGGPRRQRRSDSQLAQINREFRTADNSVGSLPPKSGKKEKLFEKNQTRVFCLISMLIFPFYKMLFMNRLEFSRIFL